MKPAVDGGSGGLLAAPLLYGRQIWVAPSSVPEVARSDAWLQATASGGLCRDGGSLWWRLAFSTGVLMVAALSPLLRAVHAVLLTARVRCGFLMVHGGWRIWRGSVGGDLVTDGWCPGTAEFRWGSWAWDAGP